MERGYVHVKVGKNVSSCPLLSDNTCVLCLNARLPQLCKLLGPPRSQPAMSMLVQNYELLLTRTNRRMAQAQTLSELARAKWRGAAASEYQNPAATARVIQVQETDDDLRKVFAVTLSKKLTGGLQTALCLGGSYRSIFNEARALRENIRAQGWNAAALARSTKTQLKLPLLTSTARDLRQGPVLASLR